MQSKKHSFHPFRAIQFRLSTLLFLVAACAILFSARQRVRLHYQGQQEAIAALSEHRARVLEETKRPLWLAKLIGTDLYRRITSIDFDGQRMDDEVLDLLVLIDGCDSLSLAGNPISDQSLGRLLHLSGLERLSLAKTNVTDQGMAIIAQIDGLKEIDISDTAVTDTGILHVSECATIESISLPRWITDDGIRYLARLPHLREIDFRDALISREAMGALVTTDVQSLKCQAGLGTLRALPSPNSLPNLRSIDVELRQMDDEDVKELATHRRLESLQIQGDGITDASVPHLLSLQNLRHLTIRSHRLSNSGLLRLQNAMGVSNVLGTATGVVPKGLGFNRNAGSGAVETAFLNGSHMRQQDWDSFVEVQSPFTTLFVEQLDWSAEACQAISGHRGIEAIFVQGGRIEGNALGQLRALENLTEISLFRVEIDSAAIEAMATWPALSMIKFTQCSLPRDAIAKTSTAKMLRNFQWTSGRIEANLVEDLSRLEQIQTLVLNGTNFDDDDCKALQGLLNLSTLSLRNTYVTDACVDDLLAIPRLATLLLQGTRVTQSAVQRISQAGINTDSAGASLALPE